MGAYDLDFHSWAMEQAELLKSRSANQLDWDNLAEELESLGRQQRSELRNRLIVLLTHLLKWKFQPAFRSRSWASTIAVQRRDLARHLRENPSLKASQEDVFLDGYSQARLQSVAETGFADDIFPVEPPFTLEQALAPDWLPETLCDQSSTASNGS